MGVIERERLLSYAYRRYVTKFQCFLFKKYEDETAWASFPWSSAADLFFDSSSISSSFTTNNFRISSASAFGRLELVLWDDSKTEEYGAISDAASLSSRSPKPTLFS